MARGATKQIFLKCVERDTRSRRSRILIITAWWNVFAVVLSADRTKYWSAHNHMPVKVESKMSKSKHVSSGPLSNNSDNVTKYICNLHPVKLYAHRYLIKIMLFAFRSLSLHCYILFYIILADFCLINGGMHKKNNY